MGRAVAVVASLALLLVTIPTRIRAFAPVAHRTSSLAVHKRWNDSNKRIPEKGVVLRNGSEYEYEFVPTKPEATSTATIASPDNPLKSVYPAGTPSGLRGEAVRSALCSGRCIVWDLTSTPLSQGGLLQVQGKGTLDFINNKLSQQFVGTAGESRAACLLTPKGRLVDRLQVSFEDPQSAYMLTSPGYTSGLLLKRLDPYIFPMDQVKLTNHADSTMFVMASVRWEHVETAIREQVLKNYPNVEVNFGSHQECIRLELTSSTSLLLIPSTGLPSVSCVGYTLVFLNTVDSQENQVGTGIWNYLISESNAEGPIEIGALEYESLRIEAGQAAYSWEWTGEKDKAKTSPLELFMERDSINTDKGCYLGQEGIASILKNPRGSPRSLYQVVFEDSMNLWMAQTEGGDNGENLTRPPRVGDQLYALGSNEELLVGTLTSVAEAGGTGDPRVVALALVKRADSILKQMKDYDLEIYRDMDSSMSGNKPGMIMPPPMDPLDGLEVVIGKSYTMGRLQSIPSRRIARGSNMFDNTVRLGDESKPSGKGAVIEIDWHQTMREKQDELVRKMELEDYESEEEDGSDFMDVDSQEIANEKDGDKDEADDADDEALLEQAAKEMQQAQAAAEAAMAEAKRKEEKMKLLQQRAEEAMARRKEKAKNTEDQDAEANRKAEKMALLQKRAEEAMARRKAKKEQGS